MITIDGVQLKQTKCVCMSVYCMYVMEGKYKI